MRACDVLTDADPPIMIARDWARAGVESFSIVKYVVMFKNVTEL